MKKLAGAVLLVAFAGAAIACPDGAKDAQAGPGSVSSQLAEVQPQMSRAPATAAPKTVVATPNVPKAATPTTTAARTKKASTGS